MKALLIIGVLALATGSGLIFYFTHGSTGFSFGSPVSASSLHIDMTTNGWPAVSGISLVGLGAFLLVVDLVIALIDTFRSGATPLKRREEPFTE